MQSDWLWEWAEFFYLARQPGRKPSPGCESLCNDLKFPFFDTESVYIQVSVSRDVEIKFKLKKISL